MKKKLKELKQIKKDADMLCLTFLKKKMNKTREDNNLKWTKIRKNLYYSELRQTAFKKISLIVDGTTVAALYRVIVEGNSKKKQE